MGSLVIDIFFLLMFVISLQGLGFMLITFTISALVGYSLNNKLRDSYVLFSFVGPILGLIYAQLGLHKPKLTLFPDLFYFSTPNKVGYNMIAPNNYVIFTVVLIVSYVVGFIGLYFGKELRKS